jgi:two-component system LytT family response regulator
VPRRAIVVTTSKGATVLPLGEIDWIEAEGNYARLWTGTRSYLLREPLAGLEARVRPHGFLRAHRRAIVRLDGVRRLVTTDAGETIAELASGARIAIARRRRPLFASALRAQGLGS